QLLTRARILLKADVSEGGEGWSDSAISAALDTSINTVSRTRQQLVEEGFEATLKRKYNPNSARPRIFDGAAEAKLIALTRNGIEGEPRDARPWRRKVYPVHADPPRRRGRAGEEAPRTDPRGTRGRDRWVAHTARRVTQQAGLRPARLRPLRPLSAPHPRRRPAHRSGRGRGRRAPRRQVRRAQQ